MADAENFAHRGQDPVGLEVGKGGLQRAAEEGVAAEELDIRALFRKPPLTTLQRFQKRLREGTLSELGPVELDALAGEVIRNRQISRLNSTMLSLMTGRPSESLEQQLAALGARVIGRATEATETSEGVRSCPVLRSGEDVLRFAMKEVPRVKGAGGRHNLGVLIALTSIQAGFMELDELIPYVTKVLAGRARSPRLAVPEEALLYNIAKQTDLKAALSVRAVYEDIVSDLRGEVERLRGSREVLERRLVEAETVSDERRGRIGHLQETVAALKGDVERLEQDLVSQKTSSLYELQTVRARMMGVLRGELTRWLATAQDAATADPPHGRVVIERLEQALRKIEEEVQWLDSSV